MTQVTDSDDFHADTVRFLNGRFINKGPAMTETNFGHLGTGYIVADRYRVERLLGEGGMGAVYQATQLGLERQVALKLMHGEFAFEKRHRDRFIREARVASRLKHPSAIEVYDFGRAEGGLFLVMELLHGFTLADYLDLGLPTVEDALKVLKQMCLGLEAAHEMALVHRDLKPENVFLVDKDPEQVKLVDFGLAFIEGDTEDVGRVTKDAMVSGTPAFVAPETAQALHIGPPADMYAVGIIGFLMLTGELPFTGSAATMIAAHVFQAAPRLSDRGGKVHIALEDLIDALLAKDPQRRPTATETIEMLDAVGANPGERGRALIDRIRSGTKKLGVPHGVVAGRDARVLPEIDQDFATADYEQVEVKSRRLMACHVVPEQEFSVALSIRSIDAVVVPEGEPWSAYAEIDAIYVDTTNVDRLLTLREDNTPIICLVDKADPAKMSELIRGGVDDVVIAPVEPAELARKVGRAIEKSRRRR